MPATDILDEHLQLSATTDEPVETREVRRAITEKLSLGIKAACNKKEMIKTYQDNIRQFGFRPRTLLYPDDKIHNAKLDQHCFILSQLISSGEMETNDSLLDIGCGYGSLLLKLDELLVAAKRSPEDIKYSGIDMVPEFIQYACKEYDERGSLFQEMDLEHYPRQEDWCILLGVVNSAPEPEKLIRLALDSSRKGLLVDLNNKERAPFTSFHKFDIDAQIERLYQAGAKNIKKYFDLPDCPWTVLLVRK
jgi:SAM-dependent methyltransferase